VKPGGGVAAGLRDRINPVLDRELRQRLRGRAAWVSLTVYLVVLGLILRVVFDEATGVSNDFITGQAQLAAGAGRSIFHWLLFVMLGLICFIVPGLTAGAIAGERERQTLVPLQITLLSPRAIVFGKLAASVAFVLLLVIAALPFLSVSFLLGGVSAADVMKGVGSVVLIALSIAAVSLACSAAARRTQTATVTSYAIVGVLVVGTLAFYGAQRALDTRPDGSSRPTVLLLNPFAATAEAIRGRDTSVTRSSPFEPLQALIAADAFHGVAVEAPGPGGIIERVPAAPRPMPVPLPAPFTVPSGALQPATTVAVPPPRALGAPASGVQTVNRRVEAAAQPIPVEDPGFGGQSGQFGQFGQFGRPPAEPRPEIAGLPFWFASLSSFLLLATLSLLVAVRKVTAPAPGRAA